MFPSAFEYHAPASVEDAVGLLSKYGDDAKIISGGQSLIPLMKLRLASPGHLIDLRKVSGISDIKEAGGTIEIGAGATHAAVATSDVLKAKCPLVAQVAAEIGDQQVRNRGTIGGSLVHADPAADLPAAMIALDAQMTLAGQSERTVAVKDFFVDALTSATKPDELLIKVTVPATGANTAYAKMANQASGFAMVGVAVVLDMNGKTCNGARIGITGTSFTAFRASSVEAALAGKDLDAATISAAAEQLSGDLKDVMQDALNGSAEYRRNLARVYTARAVAMAAGL